MNLQWYKDILMSKTIRWLIITAIIPILKSLWYDFSDIDQSVVIENIIQLIWVALALYGRLTATKKLLPPA